MRLIWTTKLETFFFLPTVCTVVRESGNRGVMLCFLHYFIGVEINDRKEGEK